MRFLRRRILCTAVGLCTLQVLYVLNGFLSPPADNDVFAQAAATSKSRSGIEVDQSVFVSGQSIRPCSVRERADYLKHQCTNTSEKEKHAALMPKQLRNLFVDEKHKVVLCVPYKTGASTHLNLLARHSDAYLNNKFSKDKAEAMLDKLADSRNRRAFGIRELSVYNKKKVQAILKDFYKVTVVRHPLIRLLSMYTNKVGIYEDSFWYCSDNYYGEELLQYLKVTYPNRKPECTFAAFVEYYVTHPSKWLKDMHVVPMSTWCRHCQIDYDMVIKLETGDSDQQYLLREKYNYITNETLHINPALKTSQSQSEKHNFKEFWKEYANIKHEHIKMLEDMYHQDFELFGYEYAFSDGGVQTMCNSTLPGSTYTCC